MQSNLVRFACAFVGAAVFSLTAQAQTTLGCTSGGVGGPFPTSGTGGGGVFPTTFPPFELQSTLNVASTPPGATCVTEVKFFGMTHTYTGDCQFVLEDPAGNKTNLWCQVGGGCDFSGDYVVTGLGGAPSFPACTVATPGSYQQYFGGWTNGTNGVGNTDLSSIPPQTGTWKLYIYDWAGGDVGLLTSWDICFGTPPPPPPPPPDACNGQELTTIFATNNGGSNGGQVFFDITVLNPAGITISQFDINSDEPVGTNYTMSVYTIPGTYVGNHNNMSAWTLAAQGAGVLQGTNQSSVTEVPDFHLAPGSYGIALVMDSASGHSYTNGTGGNQNYSNADLSLSAGAALNVPWTGTPFTPRVWNGTIRYNCVTGPTTSCTPTAPGTSHGCVPTIAATGNPDVGYANPCVITVSSVEGQQSGILFYGVNGTVNLPWCTAGGNSLMCVKAPLWRTNVQSAGGTLGACDGALTLDWNAYQLANPGAFGNPWSAGDQAHVQGWFRDPPSCKTTFISEMLELTYMP